MNQTHQAENKTNPINAATSGIEMVLLHGEEEERESLLRVIERLCGRDERLRVELWAIAARKELP